MLVVPCRGEIEHDPLLGGWLTTKFNALELVSVVKEKTTSKRQRRTVGFCRNNWLVAVKLVVFFPLEADSRMKKPERKEWMSYRRTNRCCAA